tara:strand:- start:2463 stop:3734 length:1272 start_codon:yes stop_codon:yes gene_type:complete
MTAAYQDESITVTAEGISVGQKAFTMNLVNHASVLKANMNMVEPKKTMTDCFKVFQQTVLIVAILILSSTNGFSQTPKSLIDDKPAKYKTRVWQDSTGEYRLSAAFVRNDGDQITLLGRDNREVIIPLTKLSKIDRRYIESIGNQKLEFTNSIGMKFRLIPAGEFMMGSQYSPSQLVQHFGQSEKYEQFFVDSYPQQRVRITRSFYISIYEVTQSQFFKVLEKRPWIDVNQDGRQKYVEIGDNYPASCVSYNDARKFCAKFSNMERVSYELPTEAQWEFACRAGTTTIFSFGNDINEFHKYNSFTPIGEFDMDKRYTPSPVGSMKANPWGIFDMHGNVSEFVLDGGLVYSGKGVLIDPSVKISTVPQFSDPSTTPQMLSKSRGGAFGGQPDSSTSFYRWKGNLIPKTYDGGHSQGFRPIIVIH